MHSALREVYSLYPPTTKLQWMQWFIWCRVTQIDSNRKHDLFFHTPSTPILRSSWIPHLSRWFEDEVNYRIRVVHAIAEQENKHTESLAQSAVNQIGIKKLYPRVSQQSKMRRAFFFIPRIVMDPCKAREYTAWKHTAPSYVLTEIWQRWRFRLHFPIPFFLLLFCASSMLLPLQLASSSWKLECALGSPLCN